MPTGSISSNLPSCRRARVPKLVVEPVSRRKVEPQDGQDRYLVAGVEPERLRQFRAGLLDLRSLLAERAVADCIALS